MPRDAARPKKPRKPKRKPPPPIPPGPAPAPGRNGEAAHGQGGAAPAPHGGDPPLQLFAAIVRSETEWWMRPYLPRARLVLLVGDTDAGKSTFMAAVVAAVTGGPTFGPWQRQAPARAILWSVEERASEEVAGRLAAAGADFLRVANGMALVGHQRAPLPSLPDRADYLERRIREAGASLILLDPLTSCLSPGIDPNSAVGARSVLDCLSDLAERTSCTICVVLHYRKGKTGKALDWVAGNAAWTQVPRFVLAFGTDPGDERQRIMAMPKCSIGERPSSVRWGIDVVDGWPVFRWQGLSRVSAQDMGMSVPEAEERDARDDARMYLRELLGGDERRQVDVMAGARGLGISERTLRRAKIDLGIKSAHRGTIGDRHLVWVRPETWLDLG